MRRTGGSWEKKVANSSLPATNAKRLRKGASATKQSMPAAQMDCFASLATTARVACALLPHPLRRALFRERLRPLDIILRRRHRLHGGIVALVGDRLLQRNRKALLDRLLGSTDRHRAVLADRLGPALRCRERLAGRDHLVDKAEFVALAGGDVARGQDH